MANSLLKIDHKIVHKWANAVHTGLGEENKMSGSGRGVIRGGRSGFHAYMHLLSTVEYFQYTGRVITEVDDNWAAVILDMRKAQKLWAQMLRILGQEEKNEGLQTFLQDHGTIYN